MKTKDLSGAALEWAVAKCEDNPYPSVDTGVMLEAFVDTLKP